MFMSVSFLSDRKHDLRFRYVDDISETIAMQRPGSGRHRHIDRQVLADGPRRRPVPRAHGPLKIADQWTVGSEFGEPTRDRRRNRVRRYLDGEPTMQALSDAVEALHTRDSETADRRMALER